ncbi:SCO7613 C-terminal domain-containing membrane protein [Yinghuangia seranimata]|uniref:SCO7613 C-terminal domain-containing membrane protein n=1 Tax=Yinghuangia seranimata TaxID=408067 RepID=UPI00248BE344|nr:hypothetical protein [Yinghuangia seranimata]MDI2125636.1 hypothetical protein [Yinghuangia seranimata]
MIDISLLADPARCPDCGGPLSAPLPQACGACGLPLRGAMAVELWHVSAQARHLLERRQVLLDGLRAWAVTAPAAVTTTSDVASADAPVTAPTVPQPAPAPVAPAFVPAPPPSSAYVPPQSPPAYATPWPASTPPDPEVGRRRVARFFLGTGVLFLVVAAVIFVAVTWQRSGTGGRAIVMALMLLAAVTGSALAERRDLPLTAEALGAVSVALGLLDGYAAWAADLAGLRGVDGLLVTAVTLAAVGGGALAGSLVLGLRTLRVSAALLLQAPLPLVAGWIGVAQDSRVPLAVGFTAQAAAEMLLLHWMFRTHAAAEATAKADAHAARTGASGTVPRSPAIRIALLAAGVYWFAAFGLALSETGEGAAAFSMLLVAATAGFTAWLMRAFAVIRHVASGACAAALYLAVPMALALLPNDANDDDLSTAWAAAYVSVFTLVAVAVVYAVRRPYRRGALIVLAVPAVAGGIQALYAVGAAVFAPASWLSTPWSSDHERLDAREFLSPRLAWQWDFGTAPLLGVAAAGLTAALTAHLLGRRGIAWIALATTVAAELAVVPCSLDIPSAVAIGYDLAVGVGLVVAAARLKGRPADTARGVGLLFVALSVVWSLADKEVSIATWAAAALALAALIGAVPAMWRPGLAAPASALAFSDLAMAAAWREMDRQVAGAGVAAVGALVLVAAVRASRRWPTEAWAVAAVSTLAALTGAATAADRPGAFAIALGVLAVAAVAAARLDAPARTAAWSAPAVPAAVGAAAFGARATGAGPAWSAVAGALVAALVLAFAPNASPRGVSLDKDDDASPTRRTLSWTLELTAALAYIATALTSAQETGPLTAVLALGVVAATARVPEGRSAFRPVWAPLVAGLLVATAAAGASATGMTAAHAALTAVTVAAVLFVLLPQLPHAIVPQVDPTAAVLAVGAAAGAVGPGADLERVWIALAIAGTAAVLAGTLPTRRGDTGPVPAVSRLSGAVLLLAAYWDALGVRGVSVVEAYTLPAGLLGLAAGWRLRRTRTDLRSWPAYGAGLALTLLPSLPQAVADDGAIRPALLGAAAFATLLAGGRFRLQAPLVMGAATLSVVAVFQLSTPVLAAYHALPRWAVFAGAGVALILLGWGYERRLRNLARLGRSVRALD